MKDLEQLQAQAETAAKLTADTLRAWWEVTFTPGRFHRARLRKLKSRWDESVRVCLFSCLAMNALFFLTVSSVTHIESVIMFVVGGTLISAVHIAIMSLIYAGTGKAVVSTMPGRIQFENGLYASAVLPVVAFLSLALMQKQVEGLVADVTLFTFGYEKVIQTGLSRSWLARSSNWVVVLGYLYLAYLVYVGLRVNGKSTRLKSAVAVIPAALLVFVYQIVAVQPSTQLLLRATTDHVSAPALHAKAS
jgi:hypothetical protein